MDNLNQLEKTNSRTLSISEKPIELFLETVNPKTVTDIIESKNPSIIRVVSENGTQVAKALIRELVFDVITFFSLGKTMGVQQVEQTVELILEEYSLYKFDDWKLCFKMAKLGNFGKVYDRIDGNVIFNWFDAYLEIRQSEFESHRAKEKRILDQTEKEELKAVPMPDYVKELITRKTPDPEYSHRELVQTDQQKQISEWMDKFEELWKAQGAKGGKKFVTINNIKMDVTEYLYFKAGYNEMGL